MINIKGLVIAERDVGEAAKSVTLLTGIMGCIEVYVRGGKKSKKSASSTQLFCYSEYSIEDKRDAKGNVHYYYNSSEPIKLFYNIRLDAKKTALACYFAELLLFSNTYGDGLDEVMRLTLNTLYLLDKDIENTAELERLKSVFEFRLLCETGYRPALIGCHVCYKHLCPEMHFNMKTGQLTCPEHLDGEDALYDIVFDEVQLFAVRYIALVDQKQLFGFKISERYLKWLSGFTERFVEYHYGKRFDTLKFYKQL